MVSKNARKILRWMSARSIEWFYLKQLQDELNLPVDSFLLTELCRDGLLERTLSPNALPCEEYDEPEYEYRITDKGLAELETHSHFIFSEVRSWVTLGIALVALFIAIISLILQVK